VDPSPLKIRLSREITNKLWYKSVISKSRCETKKINMATAFYNSQGESKFGGEEGFKEA
jgi:hypothetical protein